MRAVAASARRAPPPWRRQWHRPLFSSGGGGGSPGTKPQQQQQPPPPPRQRPQDDGEAARGVGARGTEPQGEAGEPQRGSPPAAGAGAAGAAGGASTPPKADGFFSRGVFDDAAKRDRQHRLNAELEGGVFPQFKEFRKTDGKLFQADPELIPASAAPRFPRIEGETLAGNREPGVLARATTDGGFGACLVGVAYNELALQTFEEWREAYRARLGADAPVFEISVTDKWLLRMFSGSVVSSLKKRVDAGMHDSHLALFDAKQEEQLRTGLSISNTMPGYAFLTDWSGLVRWRGTGPPSESEIESLVSCAGQLRESMPDDRTPRWQQVGSATKH